MNERILVVDDDKYVCDLVRIALEAEGFLVEAAFNGNEGFDKILKGNYAVLLLDIMLPGLDGWEICRQVRSSRHKGIPIIMLTARGEEVDRVLGLEMGADDYVTKPFSPRELVARVKALIRRSEEYNLAQGNLCCGDLSVDIHRHAATVKDKELDLTPKELALLTVMVRRAGVSLTREELLKEVWGFSDSMAMTRTVDEHIKRLRAKISDIDPYNSYIQTVWGTGYRLEVKNND